MGSLDTPMNHEPDGAAAVAVDPDRLTRRLARVAERFHTVVYYTPEINRFSDDGFKGWWHAYMAYRSAPMGAVEAAPVVAAFYNFAPRMVERAVPGVWQIMSPAAVVARRDELVGSALHRVYDGQGFDAAIAEAAELATAAMEHVELGARPLAGALSALDRPGSALMALWHACSIWREYRGDGHNIALAAAAIDGVECHVLMSAGGHGNQPTIEGIRGWTEQEWRDAVTRLHDRDLVTADGAFTESGERFRTELERTTDSLSASPVRTLGPERGQRLFELLEGLTGHLIATGEVAGVWPPPAVQKS